MRVVFTILASILLFSAKAQTHLPIGGYPDYSVRLGKGWFFSNYASITAGYSSFGGGTSFLAVPVGFQLTRSLNKNIYAFAGISAAPTFFNFNPLYTQPATSHAGYNFSRTYGAGLNSRVEMGLMYINDDKTFSISGSIGVERGSYPVYPVYPGNSPVTKKQ